ncbi:minor tail protein [Gordonia phage ObLaDi]|uniref:Minor tail protein n=1 Tax=Gordonia phage ObLaDi TaxID=2978487 RepID=A0A977KMN8_9CAUD|nr:minor tail protein [Gordonia phage ObLaDi]
MSVSTATKGRLDMRWVIHKQNRQARRARRITKPIIRLWDGNWVYRGRVSNAISVNFQFKYNATGVAVIELPLDSFLAAWVLDIDNRTTNIHITMDKDGARWGGRMKSAEVQINSDGTEQIVLTFAHDFEELNYILAWCNPFLPAIVQFPRLFALAGPSIYMLKLALFLNLLRLFTNLWALPDDPLDPEEWVSGLDMRNWPIVIKPQPLLSDSSMWSVLSSRFKTWVEMGQDALDDGQLMVVCRRWLTGDPPPWGNFTPRHGALVIDIVDKSGYYSPEGTFTGGDLFNGFKRTVAQFADDFLTETLDSVVDDYEETQYLVQDWMGTTPVKPWVRLRCGGARSPVRTASFTITPPTAVQIVGGGQSPYGVNEGISAAITGGLGAVGATFMFSALGSVVDTVAKPLYTDTIAAWMSYKHLIRAQKAGWSHYQEFRADSSSKAYMLSSALLMRTALWATRGTFTHKVEVDSGAMPYLIGDNGEGHFFLGDRIGTTVRGAPRGKLFVDQVTEMTFKYDRKTTPGWEFIVGDAKAAEQPQVRLMRKIKNITGTLHDLGVL